MTILNPLPHDAFAVTLLDTPALLGTARLLSLAYAGHDLLGLHLAQLAHLHAHPDDPATLMNLCALEQLLGDQASGLRRQACALARQRLYRSAWPASPRALRVLAFLAPGDIGTNTPIEFLVQGGDTILYTLYVCPGQPFADGVPEHDIAIVAIGESDHTAPILRQIEQAMARWPCPVLNHPARVMDLSRERLHVRLAGASGVVMPATRRISRDVLAQLADGIVPLSQILDGARLPIIARPVDSHAGRGLERLADQAAVGDYLATHDDEAFYISPYIDYAGADGLFRKYRIVWVDGVPWPCHMAIRADWKVWYLNADMAENAANRAEEADFMRGFADGFARRHAAALADVANRLGLDYVGIDCAETRRGELLVFEGDISLIVHDLDPPDIFPYKAGCMRELFAAFQSMLGRRAGQCISQVA